ncbi:glycosyltransferase family 2 protein [Robertmurraya sp. GLU-23]
MKDLPLVSVIILNFNSEQKTELCIRSLVDSKYSNLNVIIVDNSTNPLSSQSVEELARKYNFDFIRVNENKGYAEGNKIGVDFAINKEAEYVFVLNNDTIVHADCINLVVEAMEYDENIAVSGPILYNLNYTVDSYETTDILQSAGLKINPYTGRTISNSTSVNGDISEHPVISGAALMFRSNIIKEFGFMNGDFFLYYEETDYCLSLKKEFPTFKICTINSAMVWHEPSNNIDEKIYSLYYSHRNKIIFMRKHFKQTFPIFLVFLFLLSIPKKLLSYRSRPAYIRALFKATRDGLSGKILERI